MSIQKLLSFKFSSSSLPLFLIMLIFLRNAAVNSKGSSTIASSYDLIGNETDRLSLIAIKSQIVYDPQEIMRSWNESIQHCKWPGVTCGRRHRRVIGLNLTSKGLVGTLSPSIGNLSFLSEVFIYNNTFCGQLPPQIGRLFRLHILHAENNSFNGQIPKNLSCCLNLQVLSLGFNKLEGRVPSQLGSLPNLQRLSLHSNRLVGDIGFVSNLTTLELLSMAYNAFKGNIPDFLGKNKGLNFLGLGGNQFFGPIPASIYNLSLLMIFSLSENHLEGSLPADLGLMLPHLQVLQLSTTSISGHIPISLSNLSNIEEIDLSFNNFTGEFIFDGKNMPNLLNLFLARNKIGFGGSKELDILNTLVNCSKLRIVDLSQNNLGWVFPSSMPNFSTTLEVLSLETNQIFGRLPTGLGNLVNLYALMFGENQLTGVIPSGIGALKMLYLATFHENGFSKNIPPSFGNLTKLSVLTLHENMLQGPIPSTLGNCQNLIQLTLFNNNLTGAIPSQLFDASVPLFYLDLSGNYLEGSLPTEVGRLRNLAYFDVSNNSLSNRIPESLSSCVSLVYLSMASNFIDGPIPLMFRALRSLEYVDLSRNKLSGKIPSYFSNFPLKHLNLSFNDFEGEVPMVGVFRNASAVSFLGNPRLCGGIPELHLPKCIEGDSKRSKQNHNHHFLLIFMIVLIMGGAISIVIALLIWFHSTKKNTTVSSSQSSLKEPFLKVSYDMLLKATNGFSSTNLIGIGGFGSVYRGILYLNGDRIPVAIKVLNLRHQGGSRSFMAECKVLRSIRHRNLVRIISACSSTDFSGNEFKALIYEFVPNGSLDRWLSPRLTAHVEDHGSSRHLSLLQIVNVAMDVASAIDYLHNGCEIGVIHCDIKPSNILLDDTMNAHLGDFGLSKLIPELRNQNQSSSIEVKGTIGYAAPEYGLGSQVSTKGDIYSYGIVLLEMITEKHPTDSMFENGLNIHKFVKTALPERMMEIIDTRLLINDNGAASTDHHDEQLKIYEKIECIKLILKVGVACSVELPQDRIEIKDVLNELRLAKDWLIGSQIVPNVPTNV